MGDIDCISETNNYAFVNVSQVLEAVTSTSCTEHLFSIWLTQLTQELLKDKFFMIILFYIKLINIIA
jgi:hypothetical protein